MIISEKSFREYIELIKFIDNISELSNIDTHTVELSDFEMDQIYAAKGTKHYLKLLNKFEEKKYSK